MKLPSNSPPENADAEKGTVSRRAVGYACSGDLIKIADKLPSNIGRALLVHTLIHAYQLLPVQNNEKSIDEEETAVLDRCKIIPVHPLPIDQLAHFHDRPFLKYLLDLDKLDEEDVEDAIEAEDDDDEGEEEEKSLADNIPSCPHSHINSESSIKSTSKIKHNQKYGLEFDCPYFPGLGDYIKLVSGASVACADYLIGQTSAPRTLAPVAINWQGGRHHAKRARCSGFCYVNDVVLSIQRLRSKFSKVLYLDLDLHHGDGVETAFARSSKVMCISVHRYDVGFYPGTGRLDDRGKGSNALDYTVNIPTKRGLSGDSFRAIFEQIVIPWKEWFDPSAVVVTCGCDGLTRDEHKEWSLTVQDFDSVVSRIINDWNLPTILLGGGGYHHTDAARCWTYLTATALGREDRKKWDDIPEHAFLTSYASDGFQFNIDDHHGKLKDENEGEYLDSMINTLKDRLQHIQN